MSDVGDVAVDPGLAGGALRGGEAKSQRADDNGGSSSRGFRLCTRWLAKANRSSLARIERIGRGESRLVVSGIGGSGRESYGCLGPGPGCCRQASDQAPRTRLGAHPDRGHRALGRPRWSPLHRADASDLGHARATLV